MSLPVSPDIITLEAPSDIDMSEKDISWKSDREKRFKQPPGFESVEVGGSDGRCPFLTSTCEECLRGDNTEGCGNYTDVATGKEYKFWYPSNDEVLWFTFTIQQKDCCCADVLCARCCFVRSLSTKRQHSTTCVCVFMFFVGEQAGDAKGTKNI